MYGSLFNRSSTDGIANTLRRLALTFRKRQNSGNLSKRGKKRLKAAAAATARAGGAAAGDEGGVTALVVSTRTGEVIEVCLFVFGFCVHRSVCVSVCVCVCGRGRGYRDGWVVSDFFSPCMFQIMQKFTNPSLLHPVRSCITPPHKICEKEYIRSELVERCSSRENVVKITV